MKIDVTAIVTCHREGPLFLAALRSLELARQHAEKMGLSVETIVIADTPSPETKESLQACENAQGLRIDRLFSISVMDPGLARNFGVVQSHGEFIAFLDGDDLFSRTWLSEAHRVASLDSDVILHPEVSVFFEEERFWKRHLDQSDPRFNASYLINHNYWTALAFARRSVFSDFPYLPTKKETGFGYEDWHWNRLTLTSGLRHKTVPETAHFIRIKAAGGMNRRNIESDALPRPSGLLRWLQSKHRQTSPFAVRRKLRNLILRLLSIVERVRGLPAWVMRECESLSEVDAGLSVSGSGLIKFEQRASLPYDSGAEAIFLSALTSVNFTPGHYSSVYFVRYEEARLEVLKRTAEGRCLFIFTDGDCRDMKVLFGASHDAIDLSGLIQEVGADSFGWFVGHLLLELGPRAVLSTDSRVGDAILSRYKIQLGQFSQPK